jgi:hypothetical protein
MYGCLVHDYAQAMRQATTTPLTIVAEFPSADAAAVHAAAAADIDAIDDHIYVPNTEPSGTTFDTDAQTGTYTFTPTCVFTCSGVKQVTYALWLTAQSDAHIDVTFNGVTANTTTSLGGGADFSSAHVVTPEYSNFSVRSQPFVFTQNTVMNQPVVITVTACALASAVGGQCTPMGQHDIVYLHRITYTPENLTVPPTAPPTAQQLQQDNSCQEVAGEPYDTQIADTEVSTSSGQTGSAGANAVGSPWRLSSATDYPVAAAAGGSNDVAGGLSGFASDLTQEGFTTTPIIAGEYAHLAGCGAKPYDASDTQLAALWEARVTNALANYRSTVHALLGASYFQFNETLGWYCNGIWMITMPMPGQGNCTPDSTKPAYLAPTGWAMQAFATLSGSWYGTTLSGGPSVVEKRASGLATGSQPALVSTASISGTTATIVIVNACPTNPGTTQCGGTSTVPLTISFASGTTPVSVSAQTVSADPWTDNVDTNSMAVSQQPLAASVVSGGVTLTLPAFSITTVTVTL